MALENIVVQGAREHNLKNIDLTIPRNRLVVITGVSGSGKSSLAFDTIYAEGQRRYVESLSAYARQFLGRMEKPEVDSIEGLSPAISIDQKGVSKNPRSTVGTVTEIYDYLRLLFARAGRAHCYKCKRPVEMQTVQQIVDSILSMKLGTRIQVMAPMIRRRKGQHKDIFENARRSGYVRIRVNGEIRDLSEEFNLDKQKWHNIEIVVDRLVLGKTADTLRVSDSVESALKMSAGTVLISDTDGREKLFSERFSCVHCNLSLGEIEPRTFSFNNPNGACVTCTGIGYRLEVDPELVIPNQDLSISEGAIRPWARNSFSRWWERSQGGPMVEALSRVYSIPTDIPFKKLSKDQIELILYGRDNEKVLLTHKSRKGRTIEWQSTFEGVVNNLHRRYRETGSNRIRTDIERYMSSRPCNSCKGQRLKPEALAVTVGELNITDVTSKSIFEARAWIASLVELSDDYKISLGHVSESTDINKKCLKESSNPVANKETGSSKKLNAREYAIASQILKEIEGRLLFLSDIGLDYLTLDRTSATLSGGEAQRIRLATQIGAGLMGVLYVCDEPSVGLHPADDSRLISTLERLRDIGNTVLIVEHDEAIMRASDHIIDLGPGAGEYGGNVIAEGTVEEIIEMPESITGQYLGHTRVIPLPRNRRSGNTKSIVIKGAREHNLKNIDVEIPLGMLVCVTGVSGSGKSTLINEVLYKKLAQHYYSAKDRPGDCDSIEGTDHVDKVVNIDQSPIGRTPRSNPATYTGTFTPIRELFSTMHESRVRGYKPGRFSFNVKGGRCEACSGDGSVSIEMHFLPDVSVPCDICDGQRYNREALEIKYKDKNIAEVLDMTVTEALDHFQNIPRIKNRLETMRDVGLGYIRLGQPATHLSGGEAQRVKLSTELSKRATGKTLYILDEPTTGLSFEDCAFLLRVLHRLVDAGNSVILIEHHMDLMKNADWIIDLGPEAGNAGGYIVTTGTPEDICEMKISKTGKFLKSYLEITIKSNSN